MVHVSRPSGECRPPDGWCSYSFPPALKCGVTTDAAFQAIYVFQTRDVSKNDD